MGIAPTFNEDIYFASPEEPDFGNRLMARIEQAEEDEIVSQIRDRLSDAYRCYYGFDPEGVHTASGITRGGEQGELALYRVNHARQALQSLANLVVSERVIWQPKAINTDYESLKQCEIALAVLEYYWLDTRVETLVNQAVEEGLAFTEGFVFGLWDENAGEDTDEIDPASDPENPTPAKSGDFRFERVATWDVIRDTKKKSWDALEWVAVRVPRNKFSLIAQYPERAEDIRSAPVDNYRASPGRGIHRDDPDDIYVYYFFHKRTPALPAGREAMVLPGGKVLRDGALTYDEIPLFRIAPSELFGTPFGYSQFLEVLGIQELIDSLHSSAATNLTTFGVQNIYLPPGSEIQPEQISGGVRIIQGSPDGKEPKALQLCATPPELYGHLERLRAELEMILGVNALARGQVQEKDLSGSAMLMLDTKVRQQASTLHGSYRVAVQQIGQFIINELRKRATAPRVISIIGKDNAFLLAQEEFTGESFGRVKRVQVDIGNPLSQNVFGRAEEAKQLLQMQMIQTPEQYFMLRDTGRMEPLTKGLTNELILIKSENEDIASGITPEVMIHDNHLMHGKEHRSTVASPQARKNPDVIKAQTEHMHKHYEAYFGVPPMQPQVDPMTGMPAVDPMNGQPLLAPEPMYRVRMLMLMGMQPPDLAMPMPMGAPGAMGPGGLPPPQDPTQNTPGAPGEEPGPNPTPPQAPQPPQKPGAQ